MKKGHDSVLKGFTVKFEVCLNLRFFSGFLVRYNFGTRVPGSNDGQGRCVEFLGKTLASLHSGV